MLSRVRACALSLNLLHNYFPSLLEYICVVVILRTREKDSKWQQWMEGAKGKINIKKHKRNWTLSYCEKLFICSPSLPPRLSSSNRSPLPQLLLFCIYIFSLFSALSSIRSAHSCACCCRFKWKISFFSLRLVFYHIHSNPAHSTCIVQWSFLLL